MNRFGRLCVAALCVTSACVPLAIATAAPADASGNCTATPAPGVDYSGCNLTGKNLSSANLTGANLVDTNLTNADLTNAILTGANVFGTDFTDATLGGVRSGGISNSPSALPADWMLVGGYLIGPGASLEGAELSHTILFGADLMNADLLGADLVHSTLQNADLRGADMEAVTMEDANLSFAEVAGTDFLNADLTAVAARVEGVPAALPTGFVLTNGYLVGRGVDLTQTPLMPHNVNATAKGKSAKVAWTMPEPQLFCDHASGSAFLVGTTTVHCALPTGGGVGGLGSFTVTVIAKPKITLQPVSQKVAPGLNATFTANAAATVGLQVQWQVSTDGHTYTNLTNGAPYGGVTTTSLNVRVDPSLNRYKFRAVFSDAAGTTNSKAATLTVTAS